MGTSCQGPRTPLPLTARVTPSPLQGWVEGKQVEGVRDGGSERRRERGGQKEKLGGKEGGRETGRKGGREA